LELLLKEMTYEAESLKLQVEYDSEDQLSIEIFGFSHTVQQLLEQIGQIITSAHLGPEGKRLFKLNLEDLIEDY
jgi:secreted Zn-dependent insulinase-like peptidase